MADTGAPYFIPFVEPTDLVRDWPGISEDVALAIVAALEDIPVTIKKVERFTGSGTWTVPAGVTYAIAHIRGGGGGSGTASGSAGGNSSVAFASGTVTANGGQSFIYNLINSNFTTKAGTANSGQGASFGGFQVTDTNRTWYGHAHDGAVITAGAAVSPAASISVTVGAGGTAGTNGSAGGSGYVYIEYFEEV